METAREWALKLASEGVQVFPLWGVAEVDGKWIDLNPDYYGIRANKEDGSGKKPKGSWPNMATTDASVIKAWFDEDPQMNYGVRLGDGLLVVDCDSDEAIERFEDAWMNAYDGDECNTFYVRTSRGVHYYFLGDSRSFKLAPETDLKAAGGYVVGPGCRTWTGSLYTAGSDEYAPLVAPEWVRQSQRVRTETTGEALRITKGDRNNQLFMLASHLLGLGIDHDKVEEFIRDMNLTRSDEPISEDELQNTIFTTIRKYPVGQRIADHVAFEEIEARWRGQDEAISSRFIEMKSDVELWEAPRWLIDGWLPSSGIFQLWAPSYAGKTFLVLDLVLSIINHKPWFDREIVHDTVKDELSGQMVPRDYVLYVLSEGAFDFRQRIEAWIAAHPGADYSKLLIIKQKTLDLASAKGWDRIVDEFSKDSRAARVKDKIGLVVIDTQSMLLDADENNNRAMSEAAMVLQQAAAFIGCPALLVHHSGKGEQKTSRGASSMVAAMDVVMRIDNLDRGVKSLAFEKVKGAKLPDAQLRFLLEESGESAYVKVAEPDEVAVLLAQQDGYIPGVQALLATQGPLPYSQIRQELGIIKRSEDDIQLLRSLTVLSDFQVGPEMVNRSPVITLLTQPGCDA